MRRSPSHQVTKSPVQHRTLNSICILFTCVLVTWCTGDLYAQATSSAELINNAKQYDGKEVVYEGEVIGETMNRGSFAWLNVNDGFYALGVWAPVEMASSIQYRGSYKFVGDKIRVSGIFNRACIEHGGDPDIHATGINVISAGRPIAHQADVGKKNISIILAGALLFIWILTLLKRR